MGGRGEMQAKAASLRGETEQDLRRTEVGLGEDMELIDRDNETWRGSAHADGILLVSALPRGEVGKAKYPKGFLASLEDRRDSLQRLGSGAGVKVGEERLCVR